MQRRCTSSRALGAAALAVAIAACGGGSDGPRTIARAGKDARLLGAAGGRVYWAHGETLNWADATTGEELALDVPGAEWATRDMALVTPGRVFFAHHDSFAWIEIGPGPRPAARDRWVSLGSHPAGFVQDGDCLFVLHTSVECRDGGSAIIGMPLVEGATCPRLDVPANGLQPRPFAADAQRFYWASDACANDVDFGIYAVDRAGGAFVAIAPDEPVSGELQRGARGLYWRNHRGVFHAELTPPGARTQVAGAAHCLIVDGGALYVCHDDGIHWRKEGARDDRRIAGTAGVKDLAVDGRHLYWLTPAGDVVRAPRPR